MKEKNIYPKWRTTIQNGKVLLEDPRAFNEYLIPYEGKEMEMVVRPRQKDRSRQEEKYYHGVVVRMVAEEMNIGRQEAHDLLRNLFLTTEEEHKGYRYTRILSTTELSDKGYRDYWEQCLRWASLPPSGDGLNEDSGLGIYIPLPNEVLYDDVY